ncbi:MAG TPA: apolipoprotein N-acyltransferase [Acidimicrobiales bacterium]|nr:apolipoprotein N-acyltransferase [Acidimicrobiales bacterium]
MVLPALVAGVGLALSLPPWGSWTVAPAAAGLLWWRLGGLPLRQRLLAGWVAGLGLFVVGLWWALSFNVYGGIVLIGVQALALALACALTPPGRGRLAGLAGAMVLAEALRSIWPFGGLPLGGIALGQAGGPLAGSARLGGPLLLVGLVWLGGAGLGGIGSVVAGVVADRRRIRRSGRRGGTDRRMGTVVGAVAALAVVGGVASWGTAAPDGGSGVARLRVAAVQGGGVRGLRKAEVSPASVFEAHQTATGEIRTEDGGDPPALVVWPEDVVSLDGPLAGSPAEATLAATARHLHATLTVGVTETVSATSFRNEIVAFAPDGTVAARYEKVHRVPFGEYVPDRAFFAHLANLSAVPLDAIAGHGDGVLDTPAGPLGAMVSYEVFFADRGRVATRAGAHLLIVPTNTASYSTSQVPSQEIAASRLQAIAEGRDLVQASPTGFSAIIDHRGFVIERSELGRRQVLVGDVHLRSGATLYARFGDLPVLIGAGALLFGGWVMWLTDTESATTTRRDRRQRPVDARRMTRLRNR